MRSEHKPAFVIARSVAAYAEIEAMKAANKERDRNGYALAYGEEAFIAVIDKYGLGHNSLVSFLSE